LEDDASWEDYSVLKETYPTALLEDKKFIEDRGVSADVVLLTAIEREEGTKCANENKGVRSEETDSQVNLNYDIHPLTIGP
jgi:hypothetical protein